MLTRRLCRRYKGSKIEWEVDECAQPIEVPAPKPRREPPPKKTMAGNTFMKNRFQLLNIEDSDDEDDDIASTFARVKNPVGITA